MVKDMEVEDLEEIDNLQEQLDVVSEEESIEFQEPNESLSEIAEIFVDVTAVIQEDEIAPVVPSIMEEIKKPGQEYTDNLDIENKRRADIIRNQKTDFSTKRGKFNRFSSNN